MNKVKQTAMCFVPFLLSVILLYGFSIVAGIVFAILAGIMTTGTDYITFYEENYNAILIATTAVLHVVYMIVFGLWYGRLAKRREEPVKKLEIVDWANLFVFGVVIQIVMSLGLTFILPMFETIEAQYNELLDSMELGKNALSFLATVFVAPVGEEFIFRGVTMELGKKHLPFHGLNVLQALLFGVYHMNIVQGVYAFLIGLVLGYVLKKYQNIKACIWLHMTINFAGNVLPSLLQNV